MKKDLSSYIAHNAQYEVNDIGAENTLKTIEKYDKEKAFEYQGFDKALSLFKHRNLHIDIGSGTGWLLRKTSPLFTEVIGVEPSVTATSTASEILKDYDNIKYINSDMVDAIEKINFKSPAFITSSIVFSHIKNFHVSNFLKKLNDLPEGSVIYFYENYDTNINHKHWYIRNKYWWAKNLSNWNLTFFDIPNNGYKSGIFGIRTDGKTNPTKYNLNLIQTFVWHYQGLINIAIKVINKLFKTGINLKRY